MLHIKIDNQFYNYVRGMIDTETYKFRQIGLKKTHIHIFIVNFDNKVLQTILNLKTFKDPGIIKTLPYHLQKKDSTLPSHINKLTLKLHRCIKLNIR